MKKWLQLSILVICAISSAGCVDRLNQKYTKPVQKSLGMIYILPGIQGVDSHYKNIRQGLIGSGINCAIMIHPWGSCIPGLNLLINETSVRGNREWGRKIALDIVQYQEKYPGRAVYLIGQSGGCGVAVFCAEALSEMPQAKAVEGIILLDASLSADYNLTRALSMSRQGIVNFYNEKDVAMLQFGTAVMGNVDGGHGDSAGRVGFDRRIGKLYQVKILPDMVNDFTAPHFADCSRAFTAQYIAPWIIDRTWPPMHMASTWK